jgi:hypothetical protein
VAGETDLRASGQDYPIWIAERYLTLPEHVPDRVLALARDLTATALTPYDRALAIERFLRRFPYTLDVPSPPVDQDLVDYFLFDLQKGYCDYYATAMVVLARAAGVPARLVTGYASGAYDEDASHYVVTEAEAHAWPEVYFPDFGWVGFEPTAGRPAIERPPDTVLSAAAESGAPLEPITASRTRRNWGRWLTIGGGLFALLVGSIALWEFVDRWRLRHLPPQAAVISVYRRLYRYGGRLGVRPQRGVTPREFSAILGVRLTGLAQEQRWSTLLTAAPAEIRWLCDLCTRTLYSLHRPQEHERQQALRTWSRLRRRLWLARLYNWAPW